MTASTDPVSIDRSRLAQLHARESECFLAEHPQSLAHARGGAAHYLFGLPMHWMADWPTPAPLYVREAIGSEVVCVDGHRYADFCLGDSAAMFGHSPPAVAEALAEQARRGLSAMLPSHATQEVGELLARTFGLPRWQVTLSASDANRFALRWARAVTGRKKVLVFDGCYHGTVDETLVDMAPDGRTLGRTSTLGQVHDPAATTVVVPFNDQDAVERCLGQGDVACVLTEPALTNCGLVLPQAGFLEGVQEACRRHGVLFMLDETHTLSTGWGGFARVQGLSPDLVVLGKAVAGGLPVGVYGFTATLAKRMEAARREAPPGHSGIGTTLSANLLALAALRANLAEVATPTTHAVMDAMAADLHAALGAVVHAAALPWCITRLGARMELQFRPDPPRDAAQARAAMDDPLERALHLYLLNRGVLVTPFHNMLLVAPTTTREHVQKLVHAVSGFVSKAAGAG